MRTKHALGTCSPSPTMESALVSAGAASGVVGSWLVSDSASPVDSRRPLRVLGMFDVLDRHATLGSPSGNRLMTPETSLRAPGSALARCVFLFLPAFRQVCRLPGGNARLPDTGCVHQCSAKKLLRFFQRNT